MAESLPRANAADFEATIADAAAGNVAGNGVAGVTSPRHPPAPGPTSGADPVAATRTLTAEDERNLETVQAAVRNAITLSATLLASRKATEITQKDVRFENSIMTMIKREFMAGIDYSGGRA